MTELAGTLLIIFLVAGCIYALFRVLRRDLSRPQKPLDPDDDTHVW
jgi:hypothetical protein